MRNPHKQGNRPTSACAMARCIATAPKTAEERLYKRQPKNRRRAVSYVSTGLACLPRDTMSTHHYRRRAVIYVSTGLACLPRDPMSTHCYRRRAVIYVSTGLARLPRDTGAHTTTAEVRLYMLARSRLAYSVTPAHTPLPPKIIILVLYNRSSAVDYYSPTDPR